MKRATYNEMNQTAEGRKEAHAIMIAEVSARIDELIANAPAANQAKVKVVMTNALSKIAGLGNSNLFAFFAEDGVSTPNFVRYIQDVLAGKIY